MPKFIYWRSFVLFEQKKSQLKTLKGTTTYTEGVQEEQLVLGPQVCRKRQFEWFGWFPSQQQKQPVPGAVCLSWESKHQRGEEKEGENEHSFSIK